jgi:hypothetical protein
MQQQNNNNKKSRQVGAWLPNIELVEKLTKSQAEEKICAICSKGGLKKTKLRRAICLRPCRRLPVVCGVFNLAWQKKSFR